MAQVSQLRNRLRLVKDSNNFNGEVARGAIDGAINDAKSFLNGLTDAQKNYGDFKRDEEILLYKIELMNELLQEFENATIPTAFVSGSPNFNFELRKKVEDLLQSTINFMMNITQIGTGIRVWEPTKKEEAVAMAKRGEDWKVLCRLLGDESEFYEYNSDENEDEDAQ